MDVALYLHIPFCLRRCTYCDFNTYAGLLHLRRAYAEALRTEMTLWAARNPALRGTTLYFGGGTPSLLAPEAVADLIATARRALHLRDDAEITLEANPGTVDETSLCAIRRAGVNRLSLGVQSAHDDELRMLGRVHDWPQAVAAVRAARRARFRNVSLDLLYGLPGQTMARWQTTLEAALALEPDHLSLYALTLEEGTPLARAVAAGRLPSPDPDVAAEMYAWASERLQRAGFWQYEISNWARGVAPPPAVWAVPPSGRTEQIGPVSRHNLTYWRNRPWLGLGAGAHSWLEGCRFHTPRHPADYIAAVRSGHLTREEVEPIPPPLERGETMMLGLRLAEGVTEAHFRARFGVGLAELYGPVIAHFVPLGLLEWDGARLRLSGRGRLLSNPVLAEFLPAQQTSEGGTPC